MLSGSSRDRLFWSLAAQRLDISCDFGEVGKEGGVGLGGERGGALLLHRIFLPRRNFPNYFRVGLSKTLIFLMRDPAVKALSFTNTLKKSRDFLFRLC